MSLQYHSQSVAKLYFFGAILLFIIQIAFGLIIGLQYIIGDFLFPDLPFNIGRMVHTNALIFWIFLGFMGTAYYIVPEEADTELATPWLAYVIFWLFFLTAAATLAGYVLMPYAQLAAITKNDLLPTMGREFLEQPTIVKISIAALLSAFCLQIWTTIVKGRKTGINVAIFIGLASTTLLFFIAFYNPTNLILDKFYRWWIIHLWFEGTWELVLTAILAFVLLKTTGTSREYIEKWLYLIAAMIFITGIIGIGHHYYWIGAPIYWHWWGSVFAALESIPLFMMIVFTFNTIYHRHHDHPNQVSMLWLIGTVIMTFIGGIWGFIHTLPAINYYVHGTQITSAYTHLALYGSYAIINLAMISYSMPILRGYEANSERAQILEMWSFWLMTIAMSFIAIFVTIAGVLQVYMQRYTDTPESFMAVQERIVFFYWLRELAGIIFVIGILTYIISFFIGRNRHHDHHDNHYHNQVHNEHAHHEHNQHY